MHRRRTTSISNRAGSLEAAESGHEDAFNRGSADATAPTTTTTTTGIGMTTDGDAPYYAQHLESLWRECHSFVDRELMPVLHRENAQHKHEDAPRLRPYDECNRYPDQQKIGILVDHVPHVGQEAYRVMAAHMGTEERADDRENHNNNNNSNNNNNDLWSLDVHTHTGEPYLEVVMRPVRRVTKTEGEVLAAREAREEFLRGQYYDKKQRRARWAVLRSGLLIALTVMAIFWLVFLPYVARTPSARKRSITLLGQEEREDQGEGTAGLPGWMEDWGLSVREHGWRWAGGMIVSLLGDAHRAWHEGYKATVPSSPSCTSTSASAANSGFPIDTQDYRSKKPVAY